MSTGGLGMKIRAANAYVTLGVQDNLAKGLSLAERKLKDFGQRTASMATKLAGASLALTGPGLASTAVFAGFEQTMARVRGLVLMNNGTMEEFNALWEQAKRLGMETKFTARDAASGMAYYAQSGFKANEISDAMGPTMGLAAAGMLDVAYASEIAAKIMRGMGVPASDLAYHIDVLTKAMATSSTDLPQLGDAFRYAASTAKTAGLSFEETTAFISMMSNASIQADMAGTTLRGALLALNSPSEMARKQLKDLGIDIDDANRNFITLADVVRQFEAQTKGMGTSQRLDILGRIFDNRQANGFAEAIAKGGDALKLMTENLRDSSGYAEKFAAIQMNTVSGQWELFTSAIETLQITIGEIIGKPLRSLLRGMTDIVVSVVRFAEANQWVVIVLTVLGAMIATGAAYFLMLSVSAMSAQAAVQLFGFTVGVAKYAMLSLNVAMETIVGTSRLLNGGIRLLGYSMIFVRGAMIAASVAVRIFQFSVVATGVAIQVLRDIMVGARIISVFLAGAFVSLYSSTVAVLGAIRALYLASVAVTGATTGLSVVVISASRSFLIWHRVILSLKIAYWATVLTITFSTRVLWAHIVALAIAAKTSRAVELATKAVHYTILGLRVLVLAHIAVWGIATRAMWAAVASSKALNAVMWGLQLTMYAVQFAFQTYRVGAILSTIATYALAGASWVASAAFRLFGLSIYLVQGAMVGLNLAVRALSVSVMLLGSPWVSLVAVVTGVVLLVNRAMSGWSVTLQSTNGHFSDMLMHIKWVMQGIYDAIVAGRIDLAFKILMSGAKLAFTEGLLGVAAMFGMTSDQLSEMISQLYKQLMQVVTSLNRVRAEASNWIAKQIGNVIGVDVQDGDSAALNAAMEWQNAINNIDTSKLKESIAEALDPETQMQQLNELLGEAAQAADKAFQDPSTGPPLPMRPLNEGLGPDGVIGMDEAEKFAAVGSFSAATLSRQLPGAKNKEQQIVDNTKKTVVELQKIGATLGGMGWAFGP